MIFKKNRFKIGVEGNGKIYTARAIYHQRATEGGIKFLLQIKKSGFTHLSFFPFLNRKITSFTVKKRPLSTCIGTIIN